ncbi:MAG: 6-phosphofructokinase [Clostridiales Family XIII bacterium]|nr:6-phosphofructokinase [Clostridiales Family XIII bacterium]
MKRIAVLTSGGDAPGMNAAVRAVVRAGKYYGLEVYGVNRGYEGLMAGDIHEMSIKSVSGIIQKGGTMLHTARSKVFMTDEGQETAAEMLRSFQIDGLVVIGGDGSLTGGLMLAKKGVNVMGLPGTIDNDLGFTDYTIGFDTTVNTVLAALSKIKDTSSSHERTFIVEVMGRNSGQIAQFAGITGGAEIILTPDKEVDIKNLTRTLIRGRNRGKSYNLILKAEGVQMNSEELANIICAETGMETKVVILGYIQRGGDPSAKDRMLASRMGMEAVELFNNGVRNRAIGMRGDTVIHTDLEEALSIEEPRETYMDKLQEVLSI